MIRKIGLTTGSTPFGEHVDRPQASAEAGSDYKGADC